MTTTARWFAFLLCVGAAAPLTAQDSTIALGERFSVRSAVLGEERPILVYRPPSYRQGSAAYPVMYLLDGDGHLLHTAGAMQFLANQGLIPEMLIVAIPNTSDRTRDLTPPTADTSFSTAGGGAKMLAFLSTELAPAIEQRYRTQPFRMLVGHSFGGLFAVYALSARPAAFQAIISISPSLWWNSNQWRDSLTAWSADVSRRPLLFLTMGGREGAQMLTGALDFAGAVQAFGDPDRRWRFELLPDDDHGSTPHRSTYDGLLATFDGFRPPASITSVAALDAHYQRMSQRLGMTMSASEPSINQLGYVLMGRGRNAEAVEVFRIKIQRFPRSANTYDSLGDGLLALGDIRGARDQFARAVEVGTPVNDPVVPVSRGKMQQLEQRLRSGPGAR